MRLLIARTASASPDSAANLSSQSEQLLMKLRHNLLHRHQHCSSSDRSTAISPPADRQATTVQQQAHKQRRKQLNYKCVQEKYPSDVLLSLGTGSKTRRGLLEACTVLVLATRRDSLREQRSYAQMTSVVSIPRVSVCSSLPRGQIMPRACEQKQLFLHKVVSLHRASLGA